MCADRYYGWYGHGDRPKQDLLTVTILGGFIALRIRLEAVNTMSQEVVPDTRLDSPCPVDIEWTHGFDRFLRLWTLSFRLRYLLSSGPGE